MMPRTFQSWYAVRILLTPARGGYLPCVVTSSRHRTYANAYWWAIRSGQTGAVWIERIDASALNEGPDVPPSRPD